MWSMEQIWKVTKDILIPLLLAGLLWIISITNTNRTDILLLQQNVKSLEASHYTPKDAELLKAQLFELNRRLDRIEKILNEK